MEDNTKTMNLLEQFPNATEVKKNTDGTTTVSLAQPQNRAQRRAMEKRNRRLQKQQQRMIMNYIAKHPEAVKIDLDEEKIEELEKEEKEEVFVTGMTVLDENNEPIITGGESMTIVGIGERTKMELVEDACNLTEEEKTSVINNFVPVKKNSVVKE